MIAFDCPHCGHTLRVDDKYAGQRGTCTHCKNPVTAPFPLPTNAEMAQRSAGVSPAPSVHRVHQVHVVPEKPPTNWHTVCYKLGAACIALGCLAPIAGCGAIVIASIIFPDRTESRPPQQISTPIQPVSSRAQSPRPSNKITMTQFNQIRDGMTYRQVAQLLGKEGQLQSSNTLPWIDGGSLVTEMYYWDAGFLSGITCMFQNDSLMSKTQLGLTGSFDGAPIPPAPLPQSPIAAAPVPVQTFTAPTPIAATVYITDTGAKYHRQGCRHLKYSAHETALTDAQSNGYTACKVCRP